MSEQTSENCPAFMSLLENLFRHGLSELPVLFTRANGTYIGFMVYEKGQLAFRDSGLFSCDDPDLLQWEKHVIGMVCYQEMLKWKSLSYYGVDFCSLEGDIDPALMQSLGCIQNEYGDYGNDFVGSIYRAYRLLLDNEFLPVVILQQSLSKNNHPGLLIADLRFAELPADVLRGVHDLIQRTLDIRITIGFDELAA